LIFNVIRELRNAGVMASRSTNAPTPKYPSFPPFEDEDEDEDDDDEGGDEG
jgi:hypothetical protein